MNHVGIHQVCSAGELRKELNARAQVYALRRRLLHELSPGRSPSVIFGADLDCNEGATHGNFYPASYREILAHPEWARRLGKAHTASRKAAPRADWRWRELDCAASSDALLMNIFCHPGVFAEGFLNGRVAALLGVARDARPLFGVKPRVLLIRGLMDTTEVDMTLGPLLIEAKLTESDFQTARPALVERYRDLHEVFFADELPRTRSTVVAEQWDEELAAMVPVTCGEAGRFASYQLIRGVLAAHSTGGSFCVLCDGRRPDLVEAWPRVQRAVRSAELRCRLKLLTWQELASALPFDLQLFLEEKYGISA